MKNERGTTMTEQENYQENKRNTREVAAKALNSIAENHDRQTRAR
jgi:hypothetical protein